MSTIQDVVKLSGVSVATVSRVINNSPKVLPETREKVLAAIQELNYHPNKLARQFRMQQTHNVVVLLPHLGGGFYSDILKGITDVANSTGYHVMISITDNNPETEKYFFESLVQKQCDGIINFSACVDKEYMNSISAQYPIVVSCRYLADAKVPNVTIDNQAASKMITDYMLSLNHKRIAYISGETTLALYRSRLEGYRQALKEREVPIDPDLIRITTADIQGGYDATMKLIHSKVPFSAIVTSGDTLAVGAIKALKGSHLKCPENIAVSGFDDIELSSLIQPTLTTVRQPRYEIGRRSMEKLLGRITGDDTNTAEQIILPYELIIRESSGGYVKSPNV